MSDVELLEVDPYEINVDEMNERTENLNLGELEASVSQKGVVQPPLVRRRNGDHEVKYTVVIGQRRVMAAQGTGLDSIPVVVVDWDDGEALEKSITENVDAFRERVSKKDRAKAIQRLKEMGDLSDAEVAERLGVSEHTIRSWLEGFQPAWEGTKYDAELEPSEEGQTEVPTDSHPLDRFPDGTLRMARDLTGGGEDGERVLESADELGLRERQMREVKNRVDARTDEPTVEDVEETMAEVAAEEQAESENRVQIDFTATSSLADGIEDAAADRGLSNREVVRSATTQWLESEGYL